MSKGKRRERQAAECYEDAGYRTFRPQESKFGETDMFGLFDLLAVPPAGAADQVRLVQVKSNRAQGIEDWSFDALQFASRAVRVQFLVCHDRTGWRLIEPREHGGIDHETLVDERDMDCAMGEGVAEYLGREEADQ